MDKLEKLTNDIYKEMLADGEEVTLEEAREMAEMELKAKGIKNYVQSTVEKKPRKPKERKVDEEKKRILSDVKVLLEGLGAEIEGVKTETEIKFSFNENEYTIKLTKHRPKK